jgi:hypothetical protein
MEEKETVDPVADLNDCIESFLNTVFIDKKDLPRLRHMTQAAFTLTHFLCEHVNPKMILVAQKLRAEIEDCVDEEELHQLESDIDDVIRCMVFFSGMQDDMMKFSRKMLGITQDELEMKAMIANELVERDKSNDEE